jgi:hypothetical protein
MVKLMKWKVNIILNCQKGKFYGDKMNTYDQEGWMFK